jgi:hypothetical protein
VTYGDDVVQKEIKIKGDALDKKRVRPLAEGDTEYLQKLTSQIIALRATLRK